MTLWEEEGDIDPGKISVSVISLKIISVVLKFWSLTLLVMRRRRRRRKEEEEKEEEEEEEVGKEE